MSTAKKTPAKTSNPGTRKSSTKSARSRAREFALQGLYQHFVGGSDVAVIDAFTRELQGFAKADSVHYDALLHGCMWIGAYEFLTCPDVPWRVVLNECIELAKDFGGTDGHKYVNAVLNGIAPRLRATEVAADRAAKA